MLFIGILLILVTLSVAIGIARKANQSVRSFDEDKHETFLGVDSEIRSEMEKIDVLDSEVKG